MPKLPSGRLVAISNGELPFLILDAYQGRNVHRLLAITCRADLDPYIHIHEFHRDPKANVKTPTPRWSNPHPEGHTGRWTGYTLADGETLRRLWGEPDWQAFCEFLESKPISRFLEVLIEVTLVAKKHLPYVEKRLGSIDEILYYLNYREFHLHPEDRTPFGLALTE